MTAEIRIGVQEPFAPAPRSALLAVPLSERACGGCRLAVSLCRGATIDGVASQTSTIRVTRATRDLLADQARERGVSLAALLAEIADERRREAVWRSEREACRIDSQNPDAQREFGEWESTLEDGLD